MLKLVHDRLANLVPFYKEKCKSAGYVLLFYVDFTLFSFWDPNLLKFRYDWKSLHSRQRVTSFETWKEWTDARYKHKKTNLKLFSSVKVMTRNKKVFYDDKQYGLTCDVSGDVQSFQGGGKKPQAVTGLCRIILWNCGLPKVIVVTNDIRALPDDGAVISLPNIPSKQTLIKGHRVATNLTAMCDFGGSYWDPALLWFILPNRLNGAALFI